MKMVYPPPIKGGWETGHENPLFAPWRGSKSHCWIFPKPPLIQPPPGWDRVRHEPGLRAHHLDNRPMLSLGERSTSMVGFNDIWRKISNNSNTAIMWENGQWIRTYVNDIPRICWQYVGLIQRRFWDNIIYIYIYIINIYIYYHIYIYMCVICMWYIYIYIYLCVCYCIYRVYHYISYVYIYNIFMFK